MEGETRNPLKHLKKAHSIHHAKQLANRHASRLRRAREPKECVPSILAAHPDDMLTKVRFREVDTLVERTAMLPSRVTLDELKQQAAVFFRYPADRTEEVTVTYPNDGIKDFDCSAESKSTQLEE